MLEIDQIAKIDLKLAVGDVTTTIEVAPDAGTILQTEDASLGTTITSNTLESMPLPGQNFSAATVFVPGAVLPTYGSLGTTQGTERDFLRLVDAAIVQRQPHADQQLHLRRYGHQRAAAKYDRV